MKKKKGTVTAEITNQIFFYYSSKKANLLVLPSMQHTLAYMCLISLCSNNTKKRAKFY